MDNKNKAENILASILTNVADVNIVQKKSKRRQKDTTLEIYGEASETKSIAFSQIKTCNTPNLRRDLLEWKYNDFAYYLVNKIQQQVYPEWNAKILGVTLYMGRIKDVLMDILGFCDNIVLRDYIDYFADNWGKYYIKLKGSFYIAYMRYDQPLKEFASRYNYKKSVAKYVKKQSKVEQESVNSILSADLENAYLASGESLLLDYGVVASINWLILQKRFSVEEAMDYVSGAYISLYNRGDWKYAVNITKKMSPYPNWFMVRDVSKIIGTSNSENIAFTEQNKEKFNF